MIPEQLCHVLRCTDRCSHGLLMWSVHTDRRGVRQLPACCSGCLWYKIPTWGVGWGGGGHAWTWQFSVQCAQCTTVSKIIHRCYENRVCSELMDGQLVHLNTALCETHGAPRHHNTYDIFGDKDF